MSLHTPEAFTEKATSKSLAKTREEVVVGFGVIQTAVNVNTLAIATNKTNIATNATNIATNVTNNATTEPASPVSESFSEEGGLIENYVNDEIFNPLMTNTILFGNIIMSEPVTWFQ
jgi:hypothetical protein